MWDEKYSIKEYLYGKDPNDFLKEMTPKLKKGSVLCLAEGEGRNAVHLAKNGFRVTAVDSSGIGLKKAEKLAAENNVSIRTILADLENFIIDENSWDCIISISCHLPPQLRINVHASVVKGLKKQGIFLLEAYTPKQLQYKTGGPPYIDLMMELNVLKKELKGLQIIYGQEKERPVFEGSGHTGLASVVQIFAQKT